MSSTPTVYSRTRIDEILRQRLGIAEVDDPNRLIEALARKYPALYGKESQLASGFAATTTGLAPAGAPTSPVRTVGSRELEKARARLVVHLTELTRHADLYDDREEFVGWYDRVLGDFDQAATLAESADDIDALSTLLVTARDYANKALVARLISAEADDGRYPLRRAAKALDLATTAILSRAGEVVYAAELTEGLTDAPANIAWLSQCMATAVLGLRNLLMPPDDAAEDVAADIGAYNGIATAVGEGALGWMIRRPENLEQVMQRVYRAAATRDATVRRRANAAVVSDRQALATLAARIQAYLQPSVAPAVPPAQSDNAWRLYQGLSGFTSKLTVGIEAWRVVLFSVPPTALGQVDADEVRDQVLPAILRQRDWLRGRVDEFLESFDYGDVATTRLVQAIDTAIGALTTISLDALGGAGTRESIRDAVATSYYSYLAAIAWYGSSRSELTFAVDTTVGAVPGTLTVAGGVSANRIEPVPGVVYDFAAHQAVRANPVEDGNPGTAVRSQLTIWLASRGELEAWALRLRDPARAAAATGVDPSVQVEAPEIIPFSASLSDGALALVADLERAYDYLLPNRIV